MRALMWQARSIAELGRNDDALELYNDVLVAEADATGKPEDLALFWPSSVVASAINCTISGRRNGSNGSEQMVARTC